MSNAESPAGSPAEATQRPDDDEHEDAPEVGGDDSDKDSDLLSEIDEDQFDDYDDRPVEIDESVAMTLKAAKRKRTDGDSTKKKPKEGRRPKKRARGDDGEDTVALGTAVKERRTRKPRAEGESRAARKATPPEEPDENLTPEERRRRDLDRAIDAAIKPNSKRRRKKDEIDLEEELDEEMAALKIAMERACDADTRARENGQPAVHKLKLLPKVTGMLNRSSAQEAVLDPEINFLQSIRFFLEPYLDCSLPAYSIQRDIFNALVRLPIGKDVLRSSGIGKVVMFYSRSKQPQGDIKRMAERLVGEWYRLVLNRTDDYKKRHVESRDFDFAAAKLAQRQEAASSSSQITLTQRPAVGVSRLEAERQRLLAPEPRNTNRAAPLGLPSTYTVAPRSTFDGNRGPEHRPIGASGSEAFRKMTQKGKGKR